MKHLILIVCLGILVSGCVTTAKVCCPPRDVVIMAGAPDGQSGPVLIPKGFLDPTGEGSEWMTVEDWEKAMRRSKGY